MGENNPENLLQLEIKNPQRSTDWHPVLKFPEDKYSTYQELIDNLNQAHAPFQTRIVPDDDSA